MEIDATSRYKLLEQALQKGYAHAKSNNIAKAHEILVERCDKGLVTKITFKQHSKIITTYTCESGIIDDHGIYTSFFKHLDYNLITNVLKNAESVEMAYKNKLLKVKPTRPFEASAKSMSPITSKEGINFFGKTRNFPEKFLAKKEKINAALPDGFTVEDDVIIHPDALREGNYVWSIILVHKNGKHRLSKSDIEPVTIALKEATGFFWKVDNVSNYVYHYAGPNCTPFYIDHEDPDWTHVEEPTKVKHKTGSDGRPLITIPVRRTQVDSSDISKDSWIVFSFKEVPAPDKIIRKGGDGPKCRGQDT